MSAALGCFRVVKVSRVSRESVRRSHFHAHLRHPARSRDPQRQEEQPSSGDPYTPSGDYECHHTSLVAKLVPCYSFVDYQHLTFVDTTNAPASVQVFDTAVSPLGTKFYRATPPNPRPAQHRRIAPCPDCAWSSPQRWAAPGRPNSRRMPPHRSPLLAAAASGRSGSGRFRRGPTPSCCKFNADWVCCSPP
jgi:hypothetical protein